MIFCPPPSRRAAFSLIELLVAISIIALLSALTFPVVKTTLQNTAINTASGQINNALSAARVYATRYKPFVGTRRVGSTLQTADEHGDGYSGTIVLFASDNSLRIFENDENARDTSLPASGWLELQSPPLNGYKPIDDFEDLRLPGRVQIFGFTRSGGGNYDIQLIPPPFAIRFARDGTMAVNGNTYVSPNGSTSTYTAGSQSFEIYNYNTASNRPTTANSTIDLDQYGLQGTMRQPDGRVQLPFGEIPLAAGILIVEPSKVPIEFEHPGPPGVITLNYSRDRINLYDEDQSSALMAWAQSQPTFSRIMLFNRYTGQDLTR